MRSMGLMVWLMFSLSLAGCLEGPTVSRTTVATPRKTNSPSSWNIGDQWLYTFITPQFGEDSARLVVAESTTNPASTDWASPASGSATPRRHQSQPLPRPRPWTVVRLRRRRAQPVFNFPWNEGHLVVHLLGQQWTATTASIYNGVVDVVADSSDGHTDLRLQRRLGP